MSHTKPYSMVGRKKILAAIIPVIMASQAQGLEFYSNGIEGSFDSQISMGSSWRVEKQDDQLLKNGNFEDGNANFSKGDAFSQVFKGSHDLQVSYQNFGGFVRGKYWYDSALADNQVDYGHSASSTVGDPANPLSMTMAGNSQLDDSGFNDNAKFSGAQLMDAYVYAEFDVLGAPLDVRLGRQVVSWGESTFILGGINAINPVDVNSFTRPGAEIKEILLPLNMAYTNVGLSENLSLEAFYQLEFQQTVLPGCGTFFSVNDYAPQGCDVINIQNGAASIQRHEDGIRKPDADGQFGLSFRYISPQLNDSEFGFYYLNVHNRNPLISGTRTTYDAATLDGIAQTAGPQAAAGAAISTTNYFVSYPEDVQLYGLSFATSVGSVALSGEITHKVDMPIQINGSQLITAALQGSTASLAPIGMSSTQLDAEIATVAPGEVFLGYRTFDATQLQMTMIQFFDQALGSDRLTLVAEAGVSFIHGFDEGDDSIRFERADYFDTPNDDDGFVTESSWGYRVLLSAEYSDAFMGVNLTPSIAWNEDVKGFSASSAAGFQEGQQSLDLSVSADYLSTYTASLSYTQFMGGDYSTVSDHDFASISLGMQF